MGRMWKGKALVLVIDELQTVGAKGMAALRTLHEGWHGCPIMLVGVGLQNTPACCAAAAKARAYRGHRRR